MPALAVIKGTMLAPGISHNGRLYTPENIAATVERMQARIADPDALPIVMRTHHHARDNARLIVGRVRGVKVAPDGSARYEGFLYDTAAGRDMLALTGTADNGCPPAFRNTSIFGYWDSKVIDYEGEPVETGPYLDIDAIDFTAFPGVPAARIDSVTPAATAAAGESAAEGRSLVTESLGAPAVTVTETLPDTTVEVTMPEPSSTAPAWEAKYSAQDKRDMLKAGHAIKNADGEPSYPVKDEDDLKAAIKAVGRGGADHDAIRRHIMKRAAALSLSKLIPDNWNADGSLKAGESTAGAGTRLTAASECYGPQGSSGFSISAYNGPLTVSVSAYDGIAPGDLPVIARAAMAAACDALTALDPDTDGDFDIDGAPASDSDADTTEPTGAAERDTVSADDDMESRYQVTAAATESGGVNISVTPSPAAVARAVARRKAAAAEAAPPSEPAPDQPVPAPAPPAVQPDPAAETTAPATPEQETVMTDTTKAEETAQPATGISAADLAAAAAPLIESAVAKALEAQAAANAPAPTADTAPPAVPAQPAAPAQETAPPAPARALTAEDLSALATVIATAVAEAVKPAAAAPAEPAAPAAPAAESTPAAPAQETAAPAVDLKQVAAEAARMAIPDILAAYGVPARKGFVAGEHSAKAQQPTPQELWDRRGEVWDQFIPHAPAAVQQQPGVTAAAPAAPAAA